jgi:hypothetical protein
LTITSAIPNDTGPTPAEAERLAELITSSWVSNAIHAGIELGVFDALAEQPDDVEALARRLGCVPTTLKQLLDACGSLQLCRLDEHARYDVSAMGRMLALQTPGSQQAWALLWSRELATLWSGLADSVRRGASVRSLRGTATGFDRLADDPVRADAFNRALGRQCSMGVGTWLTWAAAMVFWSSRCSTAMAQCMARCTTSPTQPSEPMPRSKLPNLRIAPRLSPATSLPPCRPAAMRTCSRASSMTGRMQNAPGS